MAKTYTKCPTCGGDAVYVSDNFKSADILISTQNEYLKTHIRKVVQENAIMERLLGHNEIANLPSDTIFEYYIRAVRMEALEKEQYWDLADETAKNLSKTWLENSNKQIDELLKAQGFSYDSKKT